MYHRNTYKDQPLLFAHWRNVKAAWCCQPDHAAQSFLLDCTNSYRGTVGTKNRVTSILPLMRSCSLSDSSSVLTNKRVKELQTLD